MRKCLLTIYFLGFLFCAKAITIQDYLFYNKGCARPVLFIPDEINDELG